jgi:hypothetical protein
LEIRFEENFGLEIQFYSPLVSESGFRVLQLGFFQFPARCGHRRNKRYLSFHAGIRRFFKKRLFAFPRQGAIVYFRFSIADFRFPDWEENKIFLVNYGASRILIQSQIANLKSKIISMLDLLIFF